MKKYFLFICFFLVACSSDTSETIPTGLILHEATNFQMNIPSTWNVLTADSKILPETKNSDIELAVSSSELKYGFSNNLLILGQTLEKSVSSKDFSILNNVGSTTEYVDYTKLESKTIEFTDADTSNLYVFEAKYNVQTPVLKYLQVGKVCGKKGYLITVAVSTDVKDTSKYEEIIKSFQCK